MHNPRFSLILILIIVLYLQYSPRGDPLRNQLLTNMAIGSKIVINYMDLTQIETRENKTLILTCASVTNRLGIFRLSLIRVSSASFVRNKILPSYF